jgi:hypothetical protein
VAASTRHDRLALYAVDALGRRDRRAVDGHLAGCVRCRKALAELGESAAFLAHHGDRIDEWALEPPRALRDRVLAAAAAQAPVLPAFRRRLWQLRAPWGIALGTALAVFALWAISQRGGAVHAGTSRGPNGTALASFSGGGAVSAIELRRRVPTGGVVAVSPVEIGRRGAGHGRLLFAAAAR